MELAVDWRSGRSAALGLRIASHRTPAPNDDPGIRSQFSPPRHFARQERVVPPPPPLQPPPADGARSKSGAGRLSESGDHLAAGEGDSGQAAAEPILARAAPGRGLVCLPNQVESSALVVQGPPTNVSPHDPVSAEPADRRQHPASGGLAWLGRNDVGSTHASHADSPPSSGVSLSQLTRRDKC